MHRCRVIRHCWKRWLIKIENLYSHKVHPHTEITITAGGTYAIYTALSTILQPGDEVIVFAPCYDSYIPNIEMNGAIPVSVPLEFPSYRIDWEKVRAAKTDEDKSHRSEFAT